MQQGGLNEQDYQTVFARNPPSAHLTGLRIVRDYEYNQHRLIVREILNEDYCVNDCGVTNQKKVVK
ncbi:MAG TPA: hypothetical protein ENI64_10275 [Gammaproteobacteria bacterium]|nr:hypothetical protein [Gammaproteobacteria bacterium]